MGVFAVETESQLPTCSLVFRFGGVKQAEKTVADVMKAIADGI